MPESTAWAVAIVGILALLIPILIMGLVGRIGPRVRGGETPDKQDVYECGIVPEVDARRRFSAKFYLVAVLFVLFDVEVAFLVPWGVVFRDLSAASWTAFLGMLLFLGLLVAGLAYVIRRGALEWE
jgi:NADH-quinone oxidoreductase subunit A